ncbi:polysaccharide pyruvyl transferase family protein [Roseococcus thiosulfatophilus]|uniref:polysaccharide pyruvyl transferase family protein n=1 Tax=Roseococcus thiosulfatophilus TaxID=35813 RepID=UPI001A8E155E|nr:polysaccharide pyruvyl transferase family protein [Roseococcus thiosulfatophilus]
MHVFVLNAGASVRTGLAGAELRIPDPEAFFGARGINTGDLLVYDATLRHLDATKVTQLGFAAAGERKHWPQEQPDITIIRGSNYLMEGLDFGHVVPLLRHLTGPVVALGVGAQAASYRRLSLPEGSVAFWRLVAEKSESLGVRGVYSAEVLAALGIRNTRIIGCPSFYRSGAPTRPIRPVQARTGRLGLTLNRHLQGEYTPSHGLSQIAQRRLLAEVARRPGSRLYAQGEREEMLLALGAPTLRAGRLREVLGLYGLSGDAQVAQLLGRHMAAHIDIESWAEDLAAHVDVVLGLRLHGNVMALQQGIPAIPIVYDTRTREMADVFDLPAIEMQLAGAMDLEAMLEGADFAPFEAAYARNFSIYRAFLEENGLAHRLGALTARQPALTGGGETA